MDDVDLVNALIGRDLSELNPHEQRVLLLNEFDGEVVNGGWHQYLWNSSGDHAALLWRCAPAYGYPKIAEALGRIAWLMGGDIPEERDERVSRLEDLRQRLTEGQDDGISELIEEELHRLFDDVLDYVGCNRSHFSTAPGIGSDNE